MANGHFDFDIYYNICTPSSGGYKCAHNTHVHQYDDNMQADLTVNLSVSGYASLTLSFYYWSRAEAGGGDYLEGWYIAGGVPTMIFQNRGTSNWNLVSLPVPNNVEQLVVRFTSDAANHGFEGAYVDDLVLTGVENNPPTSDVSPLPTYENSKVFDIPYVASDGANESGVGYVELWYRNATTGTFKNYTRPANPLGRWFLSPIRFDAAYASNESYYEFYTIAVDNAGNREAPPLTADATTTVDATAAMRTASRAGLKSEAATRSRAGRTTARAPAPRSGAPARASARASGRSPRATSGRDRRRGRSGA